MTKPLMRKKSATPKGPRLYQAVAENAANAGGALVVTAENVASATSWGAAQYTPVRWLATTHRAATPRRWLAKV